MSGLRPYIWVDARQECEVCRGSGEGGKMGPKDGAKKAGPKPGTYACLSCDGRGFRPVEVELTALATGRLRTKR